jgi:hypothetical protein
MLLVAVHVAELLPGTKPGGRSSVIVTPTVAALNTTWTSKLKDWPDLTSAGPVLVIVKGF